MSKDNKPRCHRKENKKFFSAMIELLFLTKSTMARLAEE
jgi:hypothetical protein